jgi:hypothetical protein
VMNGLGGGDVVLQKLNLDDQMGLKSLICA